MSRNSERFKGPGDIIDYAPSPTPNGIQYKTNKQQILKLKPANDQSVVKIVAYYFSCNLIFVSVLLLTGLVTRTAGRDA